MYTFIEWLSWLHLVETYYTFDAQQYNQLFDGELEKLIGTVTTPEHRAALERMRGFNWVGYIAASVWQAGYHDQRQVQERTHDIVVKLVMGTLFRAFDERTAARWTCGSSVRWQMRSRTSWRRKKQAKIHSDRPHRSAVPARSDRRR